MTVKFYYLSGSPFAWKVWLSLEHKAIDYKLEILSADAGDLKSESYLKINPRGKVPAIVHDKFVLYESGAIVEYLNEYFSGSSLWPHNARKRAIARRLMLESDNYVYPPIRRMVEELLLKKGAPPDNEIVASARQAASVNLNAIARDLREKFLAGDSPSAADYSLYPLTAILLRLHNRRPDLELGAILPDNLRAWRKRVETLKYFAKTLPPHWKS